MEKINVIKVGGAVVEDQQQLSLLLKEFSAIEGRKVLVHGGGRRATKVASQLGIETQMVDGRRITDKAMLEVVTMVYGGLVGGRNQRSRTHRCRHQCHTLTQTASEKWYRLWLCGRRGPCRRQYAQDSHRSWNSASHGTAYTRRKWQYAQHQCRHHCL